MDYQELLAELERDRENIDRMIAWVKSRVAQEGVGPVPDSPTKPVVLRAAHHDTGTSTWGIPGVLLPSDAFFRMSVPQAIKSLLNRIKRPTTAKEITAGLDAGGLTHQAKNLYATVYPTLLRMEDAGEVVRVSKGKWALTEWYPANRKPVSTEKQAEAE